RGKKERLHGGGALGVNNFFVNTENVAFQGHERRLKPLPVVLALPLSTGIPANWIERLRILFFELSAHGMNLVLR
ncbi:MAG: hypothetical protein IJC63_03390, partial [Myxococcaceae bacterium]|nr:hypothetical protein [Myxococcaceae bacterium]